MRGLLAPALLLLSCQPASSQPTIAPTTGDPVSTTPGMTAEDPKPTPLVVAVAPPADGCGAAAPIVDRHEHDLTVPAHPQRAEPGTFVSGSLQADNARTWVGPPVPPFVPLYVGAAELAEIRPAGDALLAHYQTPGGGLGCENPFKQTCPQVIRAFDRCGAPTWSVDVRDFFAKGTVARRTEHWLYDGTTLYFDESCVDASTKPKGKCGSLIAMDPSTGKLVWRTAAMTSSGPLLMHDGWLVAVYHYLGQQPFVHLVRPADGKVALRQKIEGGLYDFGVQPDGHLQLTAFGENHTHYVMADWHTDAPKLTRVPGTKD